MEFSVLVLAAAIVIAAVILAYRRPPAAGRPPSADWESLHSMSSSLTAISSRMEERKNLEEGALMAVRNIERLMLGPQSRGRSGENLLAAALAELPPEMLDRDFRLGGRVCEFALRMSDGRVMPVDSKWPEPDVALELEASPAPAHREELRRRIEKRVCERIKEVSSYIDPSVTVPLAGVAGPDAAYACCRRAHATARSMRVIITSYSLAVPQLMSIWLMHQSFARDLDEDLLITRVHDVRECLKSLDARIEGQLSRALKMAENSVLDMRAVVASAGASLAAISRTSTNEADAAMLEEARS